MDEDDPIDDARMRVDTLRERIAANPAAQTTTVGPDLAAALADLADRLSTARRHEEATAAGLERVSLSRKLASTDPQRFRTHLAESQLDLGRLYTAAGRTMAAFAQVDRAVTVYRQLAADAPDRHRADLAGCLTERAAIEIDLRHGKEALKSAEEAVAIRRDLAAAEPTRSAVPLARALTVLGMCRQAHGGTAAAAEAYGEAIDLMLAPVDERPVALAPLLKVLVGRYETAARAAGRAIDAGLLTSARQRLAAAGVS